MSKAKEDWFYRLPPDTPMEYLAKHIHAKEIQLDLQTASFITGRSSNELLAGIMEEDLDEVSGSFFHHLHDLNLLHEQFHFYQYCNCNFLINTIDERHLVYRKWRDLWRSGSRDLSTYRPLAESISKSMGSMKHRSEAGISVVGLVELGAVMLEASLLEPRADFDTLFNYVTETRTVGPCNHSAWILNYWRSEYGVQDFGGLWFLTFLALCQDDPVAYFEQLVQGVAKKGGVKPSGNAVGVEDDLISRGICKPHDFRYWWRSTDREGWGRVNPIYDTVVKAGLFVPGIMPRGPELGNVIPATFFLIPNLCLDIIPPGYWGAMNLPMRPICFPHEKTFWLGPAYGGQTGATYDKHARLLQLEYMFDTAMIELLIREDLDFFRDFGFAC